MQKARTLRKTENRKEKSISYASWVFSFAWESLHDGDSVFPESTTSVNFLQRDSPYSISKAIVSRRRAADSATARQGEGNNDTIALEME
jgi:hypothetical protein